VSGLGEVYDARDLERGRDVSLRVLKTNFGGDPARRHRFEREAAAAALLNHPRILAVHDVGADAQAVYIISDPIAGRTLREVLDDGPIPPGAGVPFVPQIKEALAAAHERGVAHGNLTPEAILFTADGVKVIGFGFGAAAGPSAASASADLAAFEHIATLLEAPRAAKSPTNEHVAERRWPVVAAAVGVIALGGVIAMGLLRDAGEPPNRLPPSPNGFGAAGKPAPTSEMKSAPTLELQPAPTPEPAAAPETPAPPPIRPASVAPRPPARPRPAAPVPVAPPPPEPPSVLPSGPSSLVWLDRSGTEVGVLGDDADYGDVAFSPDGAQVVVTIAEPGTCCRRDIWLIDVSSGVRRPLTSTPGAKWGLVWSPDGGRVAFSAADPDHTSDIYETSSDGSGVVRPLLATSRAEVSWDWASTGFLMYAGDRAGEPQGAHMDLWARRLPGGRPFTYLRSVHRATLPSLSPDGRWAAFMLRPAGAEYSDLYVARFPNYDGRWRVATAVQWPRWRGQEIFYVDVDQRLGSVPVSFDGLRVEVGAPRRVGERLVRQGSGYSYDVSPDGQRILLNTVRDTPLTLSRPGP
jgi:serine/threonine protein kinase